jgi:hypothetical protein
MSITRQPILRLARAAWRRKTLTACAALLILGVIAPAPWRLARLGATPPAQVNTPVRTAPAGQRLAGKPGQKGATYYSLEGQTARLTTRFADTVVVAERGFDGAVRTKVHDLDGNEVGRFNVDRIDDATDVLQYVRQDGRILQAFREPGVRPTLDWANRQAYSLWKDRIDPAAATLQWQDGVMRPTGSARRDVEKETVELQTEWAGGLVAKTVRRSVTRHDAFKGRPVTGDVLVSRLTRDGVDLGSMNWFVQDRLLMWDFPGQTTSYLGTEHLGDFGGWPFTPDMTWMNIQTIAFYHFKTLMKAQGFVARDRSRSPNPLLQFFAPTVHAEDGCDDLHWLDGTVLRYCCDVHDICYEKNGCSASTWWQWWTSWKCDFCNAWVVKCFLDGGAPSQIGMVY